MKTPVPFRMEQWKIDVLDMEAHKQGSNRTAIIQSALNNTIDFEGKREAAAFFVAKRERLAKQMNDKLSETACEEREAEATVE